MSIRTKIAALFLPFLAFFGLGKEFRPSINEYNPKDHNRKGSSNYHGGWGGTTVHPAAQNPIYYPYTKQRPFKDRRFYLPPEGMYGGGKSGGLERKAAKIGRNEPCPCGATHDKHFATDKMGVQTIPVPNKYKNCCINKKLFFTEANSPKKGKKVA